MEAWQLSTPPNPLKDQLEPEYVVVGGFSSFLFKNNFPTLKTTPPCGRNFIKLIASSKFQFNLAE